MQLHLYLQEKIEEIDKVVPHEQVGGGGTEREGHRRPFLL